MTGTELELVLGAAGLVVVLALAFAGRCYLELHRWARQCQGARIAIAHKRRVQLDAPLVEWLEWANMLGADEASRGRIIYRNGAVSVAILKPRPRAERTTVETKTAPAPARSSSGAAA